MPEFYTYLYLRKDLTPYYAGKGKGIRAFTRRDHNAIRPEERWRILIYPHATETDALEHEKFLIAIFGRKDNRTGILRNLTDGGENPPRKRHGMGVGRKLTLTPEGRAIKAAAAKRTWLGRKHSKETKEKISRALTGRKSWPNGRPELSVRMTGNSINRGRIPWNKRKD